MVLKTKLVASPERLTNEIKGILDDFDKKLFAGSPLYQKEGSYWWLTYDGEYPVAFAGCSPFFAQKSMFLARVGVLKDYHGQGLQKKLIKVRERIAKKLGMERIITYTSYDNIPSANNLIDCGYKLYIPKWEWGVKHAYYFRKFI